MKEVKVDETRFNQERLMFAVYAAVEWLERFSDDEAVWEEWPAPDVLTLFWEAGVYIPTKLNP